MPATDSVARGLIRDFSIQPAVPFHHVAGHALCNNIVNTSLAGSSDAVPDGWVHPELVLRDDTIERLRCLPLGWSCQRAHPGPLVRHSCGIATTLDQCRGGGFIERESFASCVWVIQLFDARRFSIFKRTSPALSFHYDFLVNVRWR
jgi:hypothetical protein